MAEKIFAQGIRVFKPRDNAPSFVKANLVVDKNALISWLDDQPGELRLVLKESGKGSYYLEVDTFRPKSAQPAPQASEPEDGLPF